MEIYPTLSRNKALDRGKSNELFHTAGTNVNFSSYFINQKEKVKQSKTKTQIFLNNKSKSHGYFPVQHTIGNLF